MSLSNFALFTTFFQNLFAVVESLFLSLDMDTKRMRPEEKTYIAFLPLAHVLELCAESVLMLMGFKIGYSSPNT